ncbi:MAG: rhodanese-like domain-containing protein [Gammaproteobacteria bacterium]
MNTLQTITPETLHKHMENGENAAIIDVREPDEYRSLHAAGAVALPLAKVSAETVAERLSASKYAPGTPVYFICHTGRRATEACECVLGEYPAARVIEGGTLAWAQAGLPVRSGDTP